MHFCPRQRRCSDVLRRNSCFFLHNTVTTFGLIGACSTLVSAAGRGETYQVRRRVACTSPTTRGEVTVYLLSSAHGFPATMHGALVISLIRVTLALAFRPCLLIILVHLIRCGVGRKRDSRRVLPQEQDLPPVAQPDVAAHHLPQVKRSARFICQSSFEVPPQLGA